MTNWYRQTKLANDQLGMNLGKWLYLFSRGQYDDSAAKQDIMNYVSANPTSIDVERAQSVAVNYFRTEAKREPSTDELAMLQQWVAMIGSPAILEPVAPIDTIEKGTNDEQLF